MAAEKRIPILNSRTRLRRAASGGRRSLTSKSRCARVGRAMNDERRPGRPSSDHKHALRDAAVAAKLFGESQMLAEGSLVEITNRQELEAWLRTQPREVAVAFAT